MSERNSRLMSIGEVAKSLHITRRMILNYEDKGILLPDVKTGSGGNRYYTPETLTRIRAIRRLQTLGISLDEIKLYFEDAADLRDIIARLETLRDELNLCIEKLQLRVRENSNDTPIIRTIPAQTVYVYRCPYGEYDDHVISAIRSMGMEPIQWDVDSLDWKDYDADTICQRVTSKLSPGSIVLFHNAALHTPEALPAILDHMAREGYSLLPISQLIYRENYTIDHAGRQFCQAQSEQ